jgi:N-acetyltransferase 10
MNVFDEQPKFSFRLYRFNERFILSLASNKRCVVIDDNLNVLPLSSHIKHVAEVPPKSSENSMTPEEEELQVVREKFQDSQPTVNPISLEAYADYMLVKSIA